METISFWKSWPTDKKNALLIALAVFLTSIVFALSQGLNGFGEFVQLKENATTNSVSNELVSFTDTGMNQSIEVESYLIIQAFDTGQIVIHEKTYTIAIILFFLGLSLATTALSYVKNNIAFYGLAVITILWLTSMRLSSLAIFGMENNVVLIASVILFIIPAYVIRSFFNDIGIIIRFGYFALISGLLAAGVFFGSSVNETGLTFANNAFIVPFILSILFVLICSHSVISTFLTLLSQGNGEKTPFNNLYKFILIALIYLGGLISYYLKESEVIEYSLMFINPYVLLGVSGIIGLWSLKNRYRHNSIFHFDNNGFLLYLGLGVITMGTIVFLFASSNEMLEELFGTYIFYAHIALGLSFTVYSIQNFVEPLMKNIRFKERIYDPNSMTYWTVYLSAAVILFYGFGKSSSRYDALLRGGIAQNYGVISLYNDDSEDAENKLKYAASRGMKSNIPNYVMSNLNMARGNKDEVQKTLKRLCALNPSEFSFINYANTLMQEDKVDEASSVLRLGLIEFPNSYSLNINLAFMHQLNGISDSALYYYEKAYSIDESNPIAAANILALASEDENIWSNLPFDETQGNTPEFINNYLVCADHYDSKTTLKWDKISALAWEEKDLILIHNILVTQKNRLNEVQIGKLATMAEEMPQASSAINYTLLIAYYLNDSHTKLKSTIEGLTDLADPPLQAYYNHLGGRLFSSIGNYELARELYKKSAYSQLKVQLNDASWWTAWSSAKIGDYNSSEALYVESLQKYGERAIESAACIKMLKATDLEDVLSLEESVRILGSVVSPICYEDPVAYLSSFQDKGNKRTAAYHLIDRSLILAEYELTKEIFDYMFESKSFERDPELASRLIRYHVVKGEKLKADKVLNSYKNLPRKEFLDALVANANESAETSSLITTGQKKYPLYTPMVLLASDFYFDQIDDQEKGYDILQTAIAINQDDIDLNIAYLIRCLEMKYFTFARSTLEDLELLMNKNEYEIFYTGIAPLLPEQE